MKIRANILVLALLCLMLPARLAQAGLLTRPMTAKGAAAKTLVIYSATHTAYSLADSVAALKMQLQRVASSVEILNAAQAGAGAIAGADYVVVFCPQPQPMLSDEFIRAIAQTDRPVLWVGYGAERLAKLPQFEDQFTVSPFASATPAVGVNYSGRDWSEPLATWMPTDVKGKSAVVTMSALVADGTNQVRRAFALKAGNITYFAALPVTGVGNALFGDLLLDFYEVATPRSGAVSVRIDGYNCRHDHTEFRHMVDYLHERGHPFIVGVIPACWDAVNKKVLEMDSQPEFIAALRYAQKNGGRLVMQGYIHMHNTSGGRTGLEPEFWDATKDRPLVEDSAQYVRERIEQGIRQMLKAGLLPVGWITPQYAASQIDNAEVAKHFSTAVERVQLSDATAFENFSGSSCTVDSVGRFIIPENLSAVDNSFDSLVRIQSRAELQTQLRGTVSIASFPAYLTENKLEMLVRVLEQTKAPFLDLADGDHWVSSPDMILLTGGAQQHRTLSGAHVTWKAFDSSGKLLQEESESQPFTGERDFKRRGTGDYETYEIN